MQSISSEGVDSRTYNVLEVDMLCKHFRPIYRNVDHQHPISLAMNFVSRSVALRAELVSYDFYLSRFSG